MYSARRVVRRNPATDLPQVKRKCESPRVPNVRENVVSVGAGIELVLQVQGGVAVSPASNPRHGSTNRAPVRTQPSVGDQDDASPAVRDLAAVVAPHPPDDRRLASSSSLKHSAGVTQPRVCALGLVLALAMFWAAMRRRYSSWSP